MTSDKTGGVGAETYLLDNAWQRARERLDLLGAFLDPVTVRHLEALASMRAGTAGKWAVEAAPLRLGCVGGSAQAVVWSPRTLTREFLAALKEPNLEVHQSDIAASPVEIGTFDLVHTRLLLEHVPDRDAALRHMAAGLKPDGAGSCWRKWTMSTGCQTPRRKHTGRTSGGNSSRRIA
jgi:hypothetical protein